MAVSQSIYIEGEVVTEVDDHPPVSKVATATPKVTTINNKPTDKPSVQPVLSLKKAQKPLITLAWAKYYVPFWAVAMRSFNFAQRSILASLFFEAVNRIGHLPGDISSLTELCGGEVTNEDLTKVLEYLSFEASTDGSFYSKPIGEEIQRDLVVSKQRFENLLNQKGKAA